MKDTNIQSIKDTIADMRGRIQSLEMTIVKMEQSGKFDPDDSRFTKLQDQIWEMERQMTQLSMIAGDRPYKLEHPSLDDPKEKK